MDDSESRIPEPVRPRLWNPDAAAAWSLLLSPAFGAYLHAANWRALGKPERAKANMVWFWATVGFFVINLGTLFIPSSETIEWLLRLSGLGFLLGWYSTQARSQAQYVKEALGNDYIKKRWRAPLLVGAGSVAASLVVALFLLVVTYTPTADELAAEIKPLILQEWQKRPELQGASIEKVSLVRKGGRAYTGFVDATLEGQSERLSLEVVYGRATLSWELKPLHSSR